MMLVTGGWVAAVTVVLLAGTGAPPAPKDYSGNCTDAGCHADLAARKFVHDPVGADSCDSCHKSEGDGHHFALTAEKDKLCFECHEEFEGEVTHDPAAAGDCTTCHNPHSSATKGFLRGATQLAVCAQCHDDVTEGRSHLHGPVAASACTACHNPHAAEFGKLLVAKQPGLCGKCHEVFAEKLAARAHQHDPAQENCTGCHDPHGADNGLMLRHLPPKLCFDCHEDVGEALADATVKHTAVTQDGGCARCHDPHGSTEAHLLAAKSREVCLGCHDKPLEAPSGPLPDIKKTVAAANVQHGPIADGDCTGCHAEVHGGARFRLLGADYPSTFYAGWKPEAYALCFGCHEAEAFEEPTTDEATAFRNGEQNLHYVHVSRTKGRTCRACHLVHGGQQPHLVADSVPFGQWHIPLGYQATETGGSCSPGCHRPYRYDRASPVQNLPAADAGPTSATSS